MKKKIIEVRAGMLYILGILFSVGLSWLTNGSVLWSIWHGLCSWLYVGYWVLFKAQAFFYA